MDRVIKFRAWDNREKEMIMKYIKNNLNLLVAAGLTFAIAGAILNVFKISECFILWIVSNSIFILVNASERNWKMVIVFTTYLLISIYGLITW